MGANVHRIRTCANYSKYIVALDYFGSMLKGEPYVAMDDEDDCVDDAVDIILRLIDKKGDDNIMPPYVVSLFECMRMHQTEIHIDTHLMNVRVEEEDTFGYKGLKDVFVQKN